MKISMIVAYGKNWEIGLKNQMLWHISEDFKNFKTITSGHHILMGRKTFESIGKPLPNRTSIILSRGDFKKEGTHTFNDIETALNFAKQANEEELFVIGGANIYETMFPYINRMYLSEVDFKGEADAYLKEIDFSSWSLQKEVKHNKIMQNEEEVSPAWTFKIWDKN